MNYPKINTRLVVPITDSFLYCFLFGLGCYFIYQGQVVQKFTLGRTNFAEFDEELTELPTLVAFIDDGGTNSLKIVIDFNISYIVSDSKNITNFTATILKIGENFIAENLRLLLDLIYDGNFLKISFIDYDSTLSNAFGFMFRNTSVHKVALFLTTENNSVTVDVGGKYRDGKIDLTGSGSIWT